jgi:hypothetical protein
VIAERLAIGEREVVAVTLFTAERESITAALGDADLALAHAKRRAGQRARTAIGDTATTLELTRRETAERMTYGSNRADAAVGARDGRSLHAPEQQRHE